VDARPKPHGCLLAFVVVGIITKILAAMLSLAVRNQISAQITNPPGLPYILVAACVLNIFFLLQVLAWKKWAFYGFCLLTVAVVGLNIYVGIDPIKAFAGLIGPAVLYGVLQMGQPKGWDNLH
jgi:hypothetical protein